MSNQGMQKLDTRGTQAERAVGVSVDGFRFAYVVKRFDGADYLLVPQDILCFVRDALDIERWDDLPVVSPEDDTPKTGITSCGIANAVFIPCGGVLDKFEACLKIPGAVEEVARVHPAVRSVLYAAGVVTGRESPLDPKPNLRVDKKKLTESFPQRKMLPSSKKGS